jgi:hypothetical protein
MVCSAQKGQGLAFVVRDILVKHFSQGSLPG